MRGRSRFSATRYRREKMIRLERRVEFLEAERRRLECLLASALRVAVGGTETTPSALLGLLCELDGTNPGKAARFDQREQGVA